MSSRNGKPRKRKRFKKPQKTMYISFLLHLPIDKIDEFIERSEKHFDMIEGKGINKNENNIIGVLDSEKKDEFPNVIMVIRTSLPFDVDEKLFFYDSEEKSSIGIIDASMETQSTCKKQAKELPRFIIYDRFTYKLILGSILILLSSILQTDIKVMGLKDPDDKENSHHKDYSYHAELINEFLIEHEEIKEERRKSKLEEKLKEV